MHRYTGCRGAHSVHMPVTGVEGDTLTRIAGDDQSLELARARGWTGSVDDLTTEARATIDA